MNLHQVSRAVFVGAELWAPSWTSCERDGVPPDIFFSMRSDRPMGQRGEKRCFGSVLLLAIADGLEADLTGAQVAREIGEAVGTVLTGHQIRPWGGSVGDRASRVDGIACNWLTPFETCLFDTPGGHGDDHRRLTLSLLK
jgi:hypothetical protein